MDRRNTCHNKQGSFWLCGTLRISVAVYTGDYTGSFPCSDNTFNGQTIQVYDPSQLVGGNNEVVWYAVLPYAS